jgi:hypothetical protein
MYYPQAPKEPSGCMQTLLISRIIVGILLIPFLIILGAIAIVLLTFYALSVNPLLALVPVLVGGGIIVGVARWESARIAKEMPPEE